MKSVLDKKITSFLTFILFTVIISAQEYSIQNINKDLPTDVSAIVRKDETTVTIQSQKKMTITRKRAVTVFDKSKDSFSQLYFYYNPQNKIVSIKTTIYDKMGKSIKTVKKSEYMDVSSSDGFSLYTEYRALTYEYYPLTYPYTIEYEVETESSNTVFLRDYIPLFSRNVAVENSSYTVSNLSGIELKKKMYTTPLFSINEERTSTGWKYSANHISPLPSESLSPSIEVLAPKVSFSLSKFSLAGKEGSFTNWNEFGKWVYSDLLESTQQLPDKAKAEIHSLVQDKKEDKDKIRTLYQYMQNKTRYVNVSIGIGGWKPMNASEVYAKGYGDCKALTNYMLSILKEVGIQAYYTVINSDESIENFDVDFPKMGGNHVILCVPVKNDTIWLENTSQAMAFDQLGVSTVNRNAIAISPEGAKIVNTKKYDSETNTEKADFIINLQENGDAVLKGSRIYQGLQYSDRLYLAGMDSKKLQETYKNRLSYLFIPSFTTCQVTNNKEEGIFTVDLDFKVSKYSSVLGKDLFFNAVPIERINSNIQKDLDRTLPFEISYGYTDTYTFNFILPDGYIVEELPKNIMEVSEFGMYTLLFKKEENKITITRMLKIKKGVYPKEKFNEYAKFRNTIFKYDNLKINTTKT